MERIRSTIAPGKSWRASDDPLKAETRAVGENTLTEKNAVLFLHATSLVEFKAI